jgi:alkaline phosphatase
MSISVSNISLRQILILGSSSDFLFAGFAISFTQVILGGGRRQFRSKNAVDEEGAAGSRTDNADLIASWQTDKRKRGVSYKYVWNKEQLARVDVKKTEFLLGERTVQGNVIVCWFRAFRY